MIIKSETAASQIFTVTLTAEELETIRNGLAGLTVRLQEEMQKVDLSVATHRRFDAMRLRLLVLLTQLNEVEI